MTIKVLITCDRCKTVAQLYNKDCPKMYYFCIESDSTNGSYVPNFNDMTKTIQAHLCKDCIGSIQAAILKDLKEYEGTD